MDMYLIDVFNIVGSDHCIEANDGQKVFTIIKKALDSGKKVVISFQNIEMLTTAFLNTAIGQLYRDYSEDLIKKNISVEKMKNGDVAKLKRVNLTAKAFYKDPEKMRKSIEKILGE